MGAEKKVKIGFLGCGFMGQLAHMQNYAQLNSCEIIAVSDLKLKQAEMTAAAYGIPRVYADYADMLADPEIDAVVAAQNFSNHVNVVPDVLNAGKHLLTEKPLCVYPQNGKKLAELAAQNNVIHMVAYHKRSDPASEYMAGVIKKWNETGEAGNMRYVRVTMPPGDWTCAADRPVSSGEAYPPFVHETPPDGMKDFPHEAYVSFVNYFIHQVNYLRFVFGGDYTLEFADSSGVLLSVKSKGGVCGVIEMTPFTTAHDWQEQALVCYEKGWVRVDFPAPLAQHRAGDATVYLNDSSGGVFTKPVLPNVSAMRNQAANFIKAVKGEIKPPCVSAEAVKDLQIAMDYIKMASK